MIVAVDEQCGPLQSHKLRSVIKRKLKRWNHFLCKHLILQPTRLTKKKPTVCSYSTSQKDEEDGSEGSQSNVECFSEIQMCQEQHKDTDTISFINYYMFDLS